MQVRVPSVLARHGWLIAIAAAYLYLFPYFPKIKSANELPRIYLVQAIADEHGFAIDRGVRRWGSTGDVSPSGGHQYSNKAPGSSMLAAPPYLAVRAIAGPPSLATTVWIARVFTGILPMLGFLVLLYGFLARYAPDPAVRKLVLVAYALGSMAMTYSILFYSHQLAAICAASAWIIALDVTDGRRGLRAMLFAGFLAGAAPLVDYQALFAVLPAAVHIIVRLVRGPVRPALLRAVGLAALGAAVPIAVLLAYHAVCFGSPWRTGYDASTVYAHHHQAGFLGITKLRWEAFVGSLFTVDNGLVTLAPWWLLAIPGGVLLARRGERGTAWTGAAVAAIYILFISSINFWRGGWEVGPRYITAMLPFLLPLVAASVQHVASRPRLLLPAAVALLVGILVYALSSATFPYWPDSFKNPLHDVSLRMLGDGLVAPSVASALGIAGVLGVVPWFLLVGALAVQAVRGVGGGRVAALALVLAVGVVLAYGVVFPRGGAAEQRPYNFVRSSVVDAHS